MSIDKGNLRRLTGMFAHPQPGGSFVYTGDSSTSFGSLGELWKDMLEWANGSGVRFVMRPERPRGNGPNFALFVEKKGPLPERSSEPLSTIDEIEQQMEQEIRLRLIDRQ